MTAGRRYLEDGLASDRLIDTLLEDGLDTAGYDIDDYEAHQDDPVCDAHGVLLPCPLTVGCPADRALTLEQWDQQQ